jgi:hypothetical protein
VRKQQQEVDRCSCLLLNKHLNALRLRARLGLIPLRAVLDPALLVLLVDRAHTVRSLVGAVRCIIMVHLRCPKRRQDTAGQRKDMRRIRAWSKAWFSPDSTVNILKLRTVGKGRMRDVRVRNAWMSAKRPSCSRAGSRGQRDARWAVLILLCMIYDVSIRSTLLPGCTALSTAWLGRVRPDTCACTSEVMPRHGDMRLVDIFGRVEGVHPETCSVAPCAPVWYSSSTRLGIVRAEGGSPSLVLGGNLQGPEGTHVDGAARWMGDL